ncbi:MAG TPA: protein-L-isoaspartate O-methyltransferase [Alphaproteobacteria bacterium]|nr:protein-L-isoaspartate O-methyltransferase [Alphaproteobacteria bacterium]
MVASAVARRNMVESQIRTNKVTDRRLIAALLDIPRERFLPKAVQSLAYLDEDIPIGQGRFLMEPMVMARLLQIAEVQPNDLALDIGCGAGYSAAVLARLCATVVAVESDGDLASAASHVLAEIDVDNAAVVEGPLEKGYPRQGPYDLILFNGAITAIPDEIAKQIASGGRAVAVVVNDRGIGAGTLYRKTTGTLSGRAIFDANTPLLPGFERAEKFVF